MRQCHFIIHQLIRRSLHTTAPRGSKCLTSAPVFIKFPKRQAKHGTPGWWRLTRGVVIEIIRIHRIPTPGAEGRSETQGESVGRAAMPKAGYYAVAAGRRPGIYGTWGEAEAQVKGYNGAKFKKFPREAEAQQYITDNSPSSSKPAKSAVAQIPSSNLNKSTVPQVPEVARADAPVGFADYAALPSELQRLADKGWRFSGGSNPALVVFTDGSGLSNGQRGARAGLGVWWSGTGQAESNNLSERVPGALQTNNRGEMLSVIRALEVCPFPELPLEIRTDSQFTINCMTKYLPGWISNGFKTRGKGRSEVKNVDLIKHLMVLLRRRKPSSLVHFKYVPAHVGVEGNEAADRLAKRGAVLPEQPDRTDWLDPDDADVIPDDLPPPARIQVTIEQGVDASWLASDSELAALEAE